MSIAAFPAHWPGTAYGFDGLLRAFGILVVADNRRAFAVARDAVAGVGHV
jgi:hypothetical protein